VGNRRLRAKRYDRCYFLEWEFWKAIIDVRFVHLNERNSPMHASAREAHSTRTTRHCFRTHAKIAFMQVRINVPDRLAAEAQARGVSLEMYVEEMLAQQAIGPGGETLQESVGEAIDRIRELRKQNTLGGLKTKDLIHEGHKY